VSTGGELPIAHLDVDISITVTVATVQIRSIFQNPNNFPISGVYKAPNSHGQASISSCEIAFPGKRLVTSVIDPDVIKNVNRNPNHDVEVFDPLAFTMGFDSCPPHCEVIVTVNYLQDLEFNRAGKYELVVPTCVPNVLVSTSSRHSDLCSVRCVLDVGALQCQWSSHSHAMGVTHTAGPCITLQSQPGIRNNQFFHIEYSAYSPSISGACLVQQSHQQRGNFVTFISPPSSFAPTSVVGRDLVFMLDRSGSMYGMPMQEAKKALVIALQMLTVQDRFAVCAFDDRMEWFGSHGGAAPTMVSPTPQNVALVLQWVNAVEARGLTDILTPYQQATNMLLYAAPPGPGTYNPGAVVPDQANLPVIFLITDGAVRNEHDICTYAQQQADEWTKEYPQRKTIRTFTYGIGPYVNQFFLKTLAGKGRGYSHVCLHQDRIESTIVELMNRSQNPLLVNVFLDIPPAAGVMHKSPTICPDLYHGCPIVICGTFTGNFPSQIFANGVDATGHLMRIPINVRSPYTNGNVNLGIAYAVSFMDSQVADYWMYQQDGNIAAAQQCKESAIATSMESSVPCVFTQTVAYETTDAAGQGATDPNARKGQKGMSNGAKVAAGGMVLLAVAATSVLMFGNVGATSNNLPVASVFNALSSMSIDASVLHTVVDGLSTAGQGLGQAAGHLGGIIGNAAGPAAQGLMSAGQTVGQGIGNVAGQVGGHIGNVANPAAEGLLSAGQTVGHGIGNVAGDVGGQIGNVAAPIAQSAGDGLQSAGNSVFNGGGCCAIVNSMCPCCSGCGDCLRDIKIFECCGICEDVCGCVNECGIGQCFGDAAEGIVGCFRCDICGNLLGGIEWGQICNVLECIFGLLGGASIDL